MALLPESDQCFVKIPVNITTVLPTVAFSVAEIQAVAQTGNQSSVSNKN